MKPSAWQTPICALTLIATLGALSAGAATFTFVRAEAFAAQGLCIGSFCPNFDADSDTLNSPGALISVSAFAQKGTSTASADSIADLGFLRNQVFATFPIFDNGDARGQAIALWQDPFMIDLPFQTGQAAILHGSVLVEGFIDAIGGAQSTAVIHAMVNGGTARSFLVQMGPDGVVGALPGGAAIFEFDFEFVLGTPFDFGVELNSTIVRHLTASGPNPIAGAGDIQLGNTVTWNGISEITVDGSPVTNYTFTSGSGLDYRNSFAAAAPTAGAPEPGAAVAVTGGLVLLMCIRARRISRRRWWGRGGTTAL